MAIHRGAKDFKQIECGARSVRGVAMEPADIGVETIRLEGDPAREFSECVAVVQTRLRSRGRIWTLASVFARVCGGT
jgi:hypothetical protein